MRSSEEGINAINALNRLLSGLMKYDNDHYEAMDIAPFQYHESTEK